MVECHKFEFDQNKTTPNLTEYTALVITADRSIE